ncbi:MAG TPA: flippase [Terriglobia bacterium]|nr:flippase [Terriglobia bacterium]
MHIFKNRVFINTIAIYTGEGLCRITTFVVALLVARRFSAEAFGQYGYAVALASVFVLLPDMGLHLMVTRDVAGDHNSLPRTFWNLFWLKTALVGIVALGGLIFGALALNDHGRRALFYILAIRALVQTFSLASTSFFKAMERMQFIALMQLANVTVTVLGLVVCVFLKAGLYTTVSTLLAGQVVELLLGWRFMVRHFNPGPIRKWKSGQISTMLITAIPVGLAAILQAFGVRLDVFILGVFSSNRELGQFQAAALLIVVSFLATSLLMTALFPKLARLLRHPTLAGTAFLESVLKHGIMLATSASIVVWIAAPGLVPWVFGQSFLPAAQFLRILAPVIPFVFVNTCMLYIFLAADRRGEYLATLALTTAIGALLLLVLAPRMGGSGAALADLLREVLASAIYLYLLHAESRVPSLGPAFLKIVPGAAIAALAAFLWLSAKGNSEVWAVIWSTAMLGGIFLFAGTPRREQLVLLAKEDL